MTAPSLREAATMAKDAIESGNTLKLTRAFVNLAAALALPDAEPVVEYLALPRTPADIREFIGPNANTKRYINAPLAGDDHQAFLDSKPSEGDTYSVSAHDLLSSFSDWEDSHGATDAPQPAPVERKPLTDEEIHMLWWNDQKHFDAVQLARAVEKHHGIKGAA